MDSIYVCFSLKSFYGQIDDLEIFEKDFQSVYKPLIKFLYNNPNFHFSLLLNGPQIAFLKKRRNEFITLLKEMVERKQIEIIGGGYYNPILPLLLPIDRNSQIDMLSTEIRQITGQRPRGISLFNDCWDSSLVTNLQNCGIEYTLLNSTCIPQEKQKYLPLVMNYLGKSVEILPYYDDFIPIKEQSPKDFIYSLIKTIQRIEKKDKYIQLSPNRIININISHSQITSLLQNKWFESLNKYLKQNSKLPIKLSNPGIYKKENFLKIPTFIPYTQNIKALDEDDLYLFTSKGINKKDINYIDLIKVYNQTDSLFNRIMYISMLLCQNKNDKLRKKSARETLWQGQNGCNLLTSEENSFIPIIERQKSYNYLMQAENILRENSNFKETLVSFDYNGDGLNEYVCQMEQYFATISLISGSIHDLLPKKLSGNYADNLTRIFNWDQKTDNYTRGIFVDFLFSQVQYENYLLDEVPLDGVFSQIHYNEIKFLPNRHEIHLSASAIFLPTKQEVFLRKKYIINSEGMNVQYILKNKSKKTLKAKFVIESNFNNINYINSKSNDFSVEILNNEEKQEIDNSTSTLKLNKKQKLNNVTYVRIKDEQNKISFAYEPNETCTYYYRPITFMRPKQNSGLKESAKTYISSLIWDVNIESEKEIEKNINFSISCK